MKDKYISRKFVASLLVISGVSSLAILSALFLRAPALDGPALASYFQSGKTPLLDLYATFGGGAHHSDFMFECLVLSLILTTLFALLRFCLSKQSRESRDT